MPPHPDNDDKRRALAKKRQRKQEQYWEDRAQSRVLATDRQGDAMKRETDRAYRDARDRVQQEIDKFYRDFAGVAGISEADARQKLSRGELRDFQQELARKRAIIQQMIADQPVNRKLKAYDREFDRLSKVRQLTRQEALEANLTAEMVRLGVQQESQANTRAKAVVQKALSMTADDLKGMGAVDARLGMGSPEQVSRAAKENWQHGDFSDRIWADKAKLIDETRQVIEDGFAHHKGALEMGTDLMTRMNVSHANALRVVRTEFNHLSNQAALAEYQAKGIKRYKFVAAIDSRTSDICSELNGKVFNVADAKVGKNFPPMHPNCRSTTVPVVDWGNPDDWDFSNIELDDAELASLGMDGEEARRLDKTAPRNPDAVTMPPLSIRDANQAAEDTESVTRRMEREAIIREQGAAIEAKARAVQDDVARIDDDITFYRRGIDGVEMVAPRAAIEAENLDKVYIRLKQAELELDRLQTKAAKLDETVPKPAPERAKQLADEIDARINARKTRREDESLSDKQRIAKALPPRLDTEPEPETAIAIVPRSPFGKLWRKLRDKLDKTKEQFNAWLYDLGRPARIIRQAMTVSMAIPDFPYDGDSGDDMPRTEAIKLADKIAERRKKSRGGQLFTEEEKALIERWHTSHPDRNPESVIAVRIVGKRPVVVDRAGLTHMLNRHHDYLVRVFDNEDSIIDGLFHLLTRGQNLGPMRNKKKGDSAPRITYKGEWHGKTIAVSINVDEDRIFGVNKP